MTDLYILREARVLARFCRRWRLQDWEAIQIGFAVKYAERHRRER